MEYELIFDDNCEVEIDRTKKEVKLITSTSDTIFRNTVKDFRKLEKKLQNLNFADTAILINRTRKAFAC